MDGLILLLAGHDTTANMISLEPLPYYNIRRIFSGCAWLMIRFSPKSSWRN